MFRLLSESHHQALHNLLPHFHALQDLTSYCCRFAWDLSQGLFYVLANSHELLGSCCNHPQQSIYLKTLRHITYYSTSTW
jgi:hypothetical protein